MKTSTGIKVIKRYSNRKLYDTQISSYTTLGEIFVLVNEGVAFQVVNNKSQEDITNDTILSALSEYYRLNKSSDLLGLLGTVTSFIKTNGVVPVTPLPVGSSVVDTPATVGGLNE